VAVEDFVCIGVTVVVEDWEGRVTGTLERDGAPDCEGVGYVEGATGFPTIVIIIAAPSRTISDVKRVFSHTWFVTPLCVTTAHEGTGATPHGSVTLHFCVLSEVQDDVRNPIEYCWLAWRLQPLPVTSNATGIIATDAVVASCVKGAEIGLPTGAPDGKEYNVISIVQAVVRAGGFTKRLRPVAVPDTCTGNLNILTCLHIVPVVKVPLAGLEEAGRSKYPIV